MKRRHKRTLQYTQKTQEYCIQSNSTLCKTTCIHVYIILLMLSLLGALEINHSTWTLKP